MDCKEKYNKLVNAIKVLQETNPSDEGIQNWVNDNVPELAESEDELTWLTKYIEEEAYSLSMDIRDNEDRIKLKKLQKALDWLEKQGQKPFNYECANIPQKDFSPSIGIEIPFGAKDSELQEATYLIPEGFHAEIKDNEVLIKKGKQKPAWSEEDEKMKDLIISVLEVNHSKGIFKVGLRAIRTEEIVSWLKSLKQRHTWKPSKEQMDAMQMAVSYFGYSWTSKEQKLLESLYKDLKKL